VKVLVTGGSGWVGGYCIAALHSAGWEVVTLGRSSPAGKPRGDHLDADLLDAPRLADTLRELRVDRVVHLAGETGRSAADLSLPDFWTGNVQATLNLLEGLDASCGGVLVVSSAAVYGAAGAAGKRTAETTCPQPTSWYGLTKAAQERVAILTAKRRGIPVGVARIFNLVGPDGPLRTVAHDWARRLVGQQRAGEPLVIESPETVRDFVDVRDAVEALRLLLAHLGTDDAAPVWNVCSGRETRMSELAGLLAARIPGAAHVDFRTRAPGFGNVPYQVGDPSAIRRETGWEAGTSLEASLAALVTEVIDDAKPAYPADQNLMSR
jgi:nucleoside-diphosphate-sugar epimerase